VDGGGQFENYESQFETDGGQFETYGGQFETYADLLPKLLTTQPE
jgi:hypothetical protein